MIGIVILVISVFVSAKRACEWLTMVVTRMPNDPYYAVCLGGPLDGYRFDWNRDGHPPPFPPDGVYLFTDQVDREGRACFEWDTSEVGKRALEQQLQREAQQREQRE